MPHYAVKCNPDTGVLAILAALGSSFDCASATEVDMVMALGVTPDRIIYANPCKMPAHLAVRDCGVGLTTFDSVAELHKIYELAPEMKVVLRLRADDPDARCVLGNKFGAEPPEIEPLLTAAKHLGIHVEGVAFHVGSGATNPRAFRVALERARLAFDIAERIGLPPLKLVDIGGGFSGSVRTVAATNDSDVTLAEVAKTVNASLEEFFPSPPASASSRSPAGTLPRPPPPWPRWSSPVASAPRRTALWPRAGTPTSTSCLMVSTA